MTRAGWLAFGLLAAAGLGAGVLPDGAVHGAFTQVKRVRGLSRPIVSRGAFALLPGRGLLWRTDRPLPSLLVVGPDGVTLVEDGAARRLARGAEALDLVRRLLAGDARALSKDFRVERRGGAGAWTLRLRPRPGALAGALREAEVAGGAVPRRVDWKEADGDETLLTFADVASGPGALGAAEGARLGR